MAESGKNDLADTSKNNKKEKTKMSNTSLLVLVTVLFVFVALYFVSLFVGGPVKEFYTGALPFLMTGLLIIGITILTSATK